MNYYFNSKVVKIKWEHYWRAQLIVSAIVFLVYPLFYTSGSLYIYAWLFNKTQWKIFDNYYLINILIIPALFFILYTIFRKKKMTKIFNTENYKFGERTAILIFPPLLAFLGTIFILNHFSLLRERVCYIEHLKDMNGHRDSTECYHIMYYYIDYENYFYEHRFDTGDRKNPSTTISTFVVCPIMDSLDEVVKGDKQKKWLGFEYSKHFSGYVAENNSIIEDYKHAQVDSFLSHRPIRYFKEGGWTTNNRYKSLISDKVNGDTSILNHIEIFEPFFEEYTYYDGYSFVLYGILFFMGSCAFIFIAIFFRDLNGEIMYELYEEEYQKKIQNP